MMNTETAKKMAMHRQAVMEDFLEEFMEVGNCETSSQSWLKTRIESCNAGFLEWKVAVIHLGHDKKAS